MDVRIEEIKCLKEFEALAPQWTDLLAHSACNTLFLTPAWLSAWWKTHGRQYEVRVLCAYEGDRLVAAAPLCARRTRYYRVPLKELCFLGDLTSDRQDFLALPGREAAVEAIWTRLHTRSCGSALVRLEHMPAGSATIEAGCRVWKQLEWEECSTQPFLPVDSDWATYELTLSRKFRSEMRTRPKVFDQWGAWRLTVDEGQTVVDQLDELIAVEMRSAKASAGRSFYRSETNREFMRRILTEPGDIRPLLFVLRLDGRMISYIIGFVYGGVYHAYNGAYLPGYEKGAVGAWLFHQTVKHAFESHMTGFDFLRGDSYFKSRWQPGLRPHVRVVAFQPGPVGALLRLAVFRVRPWLKGSLSGRRGSGPALAPEDWRST